MLGIFFALVWVLRRASPPGAALLPTEAFEVLGRAPLANRQQAHLLRCGNKLLLISAGAAGAEPLTEITDPAEVDRLTELCRQARPSIATTALGRFSAEGEERWLTKAEGGRRKAEWSVNATVPVLILSTHTRYSVLTPGPTASDRAMSWLLLAVCLLFCSSAVAADRTAQPSNQPIVARAARGLGRRTEGLDESRGARLQSASHAAAGGAQPGAGRAADDHLLRSHRRRVESAAAGDGHAKPAAHASHHHAGAVPDAAGDVARLEAGVRRGGRALHAAPDRRRAGVEGGRGPDPPLHEHADRARRRTPKTCGSS